MTNNEKRSTRSQASISDYFSKVPLDLSPLKQARSAMRNADLVVATDSLDVGSSTGVTSGKKRSASPPVIDREESVGRELKRSKTSADEDEAHESSSSSGWKLQPFPTLNKPSIRPPSSVSSSTTPTRSVGSSPRARSVPPSIPTTPGQVPHLDLSKYRSPTKSAYRIRMMSVPPSSPVREGGEGGEGVGMGLGLGLGVDRDLDKTPVPRMVVERVEKVRRNLDHPLPALVIASTSGSQNDDPFSLEPDALPKTPVQKSWLHPGSMSPLTPLDSLDFSDRPPSLTPPPVPPPNNTITTDLMDVDPPAPSPQPQPQPPPQPQPQPPSEPRPNPRPVITKQPSHLIPPQPRPLSFRLPSRSPTPPSQRVSRSRSGSVDPPIPTLPYPLVPSTSNISNGPPALEPEPIPPVALTILDPQPPEKHGPSEITPSVTPPTTAEVVVPVPAPAPAPVPTPAPGTVETDEKGKGKAVEPTPGPSKLPAAKPIKFTRFRPTANRGPGGVTRTKATKVIVRPTPISRERRVTRSSTAKNRQVDMPREKDKDKGPGDAATELKGGDGEKGEVEKEKETKDGTNLGKYTARSTFVQADTRASISQRLHQLRSRQSHGSRWVLLYPPLARRRSRDHPLRPNQNQSAMGSRPLESPVNLVLPPP